MCAGKIRTESLTGCQLMRFNQGAAVTPPPACEPAQGAFCFIDEHAHWAVIGDDLPLRQYEMLSAEALDAGRLDRWIWPQGFSAPPPESSAFSVARLWSPDHYCRPSCL
jgi:hypothetical protein